MDRFKSSRFRRLISVIILLNLSFLIISCSNYKKIKIEIVDSNNIKLNNYEINIVGYFNKQVESNEDLTLKLKKGEYLIRVFKDNYFPYENVYNINEINNIVIKIKNLEEGIDEINDKVAFEIRNLTKFFVKFDGKIEGKDISFNAFFNMNNNTIKVTSKYLEKEVVINKIDSTYFYNDKDVPINVQNYFNEIIKMIQESVIFIKELPLKIENKKYRSTNGYIIIEIANKYINLEINGYIILDGINLSFKNESLYIKAIDEMGRESEFYLNFYIK